MIFSFNFMFSLIYYTFIKLKFVKQPLFFVIKIKKARTKEHKKI
jgi:hypothetical protein